MEFFAQFSLKKFILPGLLCGVAVFSSWVSAHEIYRAGTPIPSGAIVIENKVLVRQSCATPCLSRTKTGQCMASGSQVCGVAFNCVSHCLSREPSGECAQYKADFCGTDARCETQCASKADGRCVVYTSDRCQTGL